METSYRKSNLFLLVSQRYLSDNTEKTKAKYALEKVAEKVKVVLKKYNDSVEDLKIDLASVNDKQQLLYDYNPVSGEVSNYQYTKENKKKLNKSIDELFDSKVEVEAHLLKEEDIPENFTEEIKEYFNGFVIKPEKQNEKL